MSLINCGIRPIFEPDNKIPTSQSWHNLFIAFGYKTFIVRFGAVMLCCVMCCGVMCYGLVSQFIF